jgi:hypothetical protein
MCILGSETPFPGEASGSQAPISLTLEPPNIWSTVLGFRFEFPDQIPFNLHFFWTKRDFFSAMHLRTIQADVPDRLI